MKSDIENSKLINSHNISAIKYRAKKLVSATAFFTVLLISLNADADHHLWKIHEVFSNADESVQYIQLHSGESGQGNLAGQSLVSHNAEHSIDFLFDKNLEGDTTNANLLLATSAFAELTGLEPDFIIPAEFVSVSGGRLTFADGADEFQFQRESLPLNGTQALNREGLPVNADPRNLSGFSTGLAAPSWATFDEDAGVLNLPEVVVLDTGIANVSLRMDSNSLQFILLDDYYFYQEGITAGFGAARLQEGNTLYAHVVVTANSYYEFTLSLIAFEPVMFGNPLLLRSEGLPATLIVEPKAVETIDSIVRGQVFYNQFCAFCHGADGTGASANDLVGNTGFRSVSSLRNKTVGTMPFDNPSLCVDSGENKCATDVSNYIFYVLQSTN